jgi:ubiquinone/menaquinone biosynthesis C-methylase UbiE
MAIEHSVHVNESGLPLNAIEWLETHHRGKLTERELMINDLHLDSATTIIDAGCGPGLWTPLLARALGPGGHILGIDVSAEALITAQQRSRGQWYEGCVCYKQSSMEHLPVPNGSIQTIFSANVSQYLPEPVATFEALGRYLVPGGTLAVKDIDFGTMCFYNINIALQKRVFQARIDWEKERILQDYMFEDSWVGSKLASYLRAAGYTNVEEKSYKVARQAPLTLDFRTYLQGIASWFVSEEAPFLVREDVEDWLLCFSDHEQAALMQEDFAYEETEFMVTGVWPGQCSLRYFDMHVTALETGHICR